MKWCRASSAPYGYTAHVSGAPAGCLASSGINLELDGYWADKLPVSRKGTRWLNVFNILNCYRLIDPGSNHNGWRPYQGLMQLLNPWTATEVLWNAMQIKTLNPCQQKGLADQRWVFEAHLNHIHVVR